MASTSSTKTSKSCSLKSCKLGPVDGKSSRAEVKSAIPSGGVQKFQEKLLVRWDRNGEAMFHRNCWEFLLSALKRKGRLSGKRSASGVIMNDGLNISNNEKIMIQQASETAEMFDSEVDMRTQAERVANMICSAKHCVFFTGAGISTSAGLGDYRGKGGKWTEQDREAVDMDSVFHKNQADFDIGETIGPMTRRTRSAKSNSQGKTEVDEKTVKSVLKLEKSEEEEEEENSVDYENLRPTFTHEAIKKLVDMGHIKYLISQNCDGLHLLSGFPADKISELHGNVFVEKCEQCETRYERPFYVCDDIGDIYLEEMADYKKSTVIKPNFLKKCHKCGLSHRTGRKCEKKGCRGNLIDTIINFCDDLEDQVLDKAFDAAESCDLLVCLGTTLMVTPASDVVDMIERPGRIVICNRQETAKDKDCCKTDKSGTQLGVRVYGDCDVLMKAVMQFILGETEFQCFESELSTKMQQYEKERKISE